MSSLHQQLVSGHSWKMTHSRSSLELCFKHLIMNEIPQSKDK